MQKESDISPASLSRSRSNSHSGKKEPKSGESVAIQDSGFSTETTSSKEAHSASSTTNATSTTTTTTGGGGSSNGAEVLMAMSSNSRGSSRLGGSAITLVAGESSSSSSQSPSPPGSNELWTLLDVIHRKSTRLREELDGHPSVSSSGSSSNSNTAKGSNALQLHFQKQLSRLSKDDVQILRKERDRLLERLSDLQTDTVTDRMKIASMQAEISGLCLSKRQLEERLKQVMSQSRELNNGIRDLHSQHVGERPAASSSRLMVMAPSARGNSEGNEQQTAVGGDSDSNVNCSKSANCDEGDGGLGRLDGVVSSPHRVNKVRLLDSKKIASILLETNYVELQRHLLTLTVQNQVSWIILWNWNFRGGEGNYFY